MAAEQHDLGSLTSFGPSFPTPDTPEGGDYAIRDAKGQIVAETFARSDYTVTQPAEAYARLFAASPDLLRACQTFETWLRREEAGLPGGVVRDTPEGEARWREWYDENLRLCAEAQTQARAAIAKATGGGHG